MNSEQDIKELAGVVKALFEERLGSFRAEDFVAVAGELGFYAYTKTSLEEQPRLVAENYLPDISGINLEHALQAYKWKTHVPMTEDGLIVSGFWDYSKEPVPEGYELAMEGSVLKKKSVSRLNSI